MMIKKKILQLVLGIGALLSLFLWVGLGGTVCPPDPKPVDLLILLVVIFIFSLIGIGLKSDTK